MSDDLREKVYLNDVLSSVRFLGSLGGYELDAYLRSEVLPMLERLDESRYYELERKLLSGSLVELGDVRIPLAGLSCSCGADPCPLVFGLDVGGFCDDAEDCRRQLSELEDDAKLGSRFRRVRDELKALLA